MSAVKTKSRLTEQKFKTLFGSTKKKHYVGASVYYTDPTGKDIRHRGDMYFSTIDSLYALKDKYDIQFDCIYNLDGKYELNSLLQIEWFFDIVKKHSLAVAEQCILIWQSGFEYNLEDACEYHEIKFVGEKTDTEIGEAVAKWHKERDPSYQINPVELESLGRKEREDNMHLIGGHLYYQ